MNVPPVILASSSPRRTALLQMIGIPHTVLPADIDESYRAGERPEAYVERLAREKGQVIAASHPDALVIAADTTVVVDDEALGKPCDTRDAARMLALLSGRTHTVLTAVALHRGDTVVSAVESVAVTFRELSSNDIAAYVATGEPMDKAGAYGIQGLGATLVMRIGGDYFAVMGLALARMVELMGRLNIQYAFPGLRNGSRAP
ncbi:MAG TPA: Maf family protein [Gemmatimonadaceae bacterium]|nr:Maf family protein [Gemmatimonadaceae bacterium]